jgi:hypothetical protein
MKVIQEITQWDVEYTVPNHVYFVNDSRDKMFAYVALGSAQVQKFKTPIKFSASRRKFREVENAWLYQAPEVAKLQGRVWKVAGSKGAEYTVTELAGVRSCTCTGFRFRGACKHTTA